MKKHFPALYKFRDGEEVIIGGWLIPLGHDDSVDG
jgi:hypothetical protein